MKLQDVVDTRSHAIKQYTFRLNEEELRAILTAIEVANAVTPKSPYMDSLRRTRTRVNIAKKELAKALKLAEISL